MSDLYNSTRETWKNIWQDASLKVELEALTYTRAQEILALYTPYLPQDGIVLEAGCGLAATVIWLREHGFDVIGLDYAVQALHKARAYDPTLALQAGDIHHLPYADASLGAYLSFGVLEHFAHGMGPALQEAARVLRPGGVLVLTIPYPSVVYRLVQWRRKQRGESRLTNDDFYESTYTQHDLRREAQAAGFEVVAVHPTSHAFTLWGLGGPFRAEGYYRTTPLADGLGRVLKTFLPWPFNFSTLLIGRIPA
ncbi:MAG: class I SAM-dependent methyltransferase [Anaerolineae bacterium]|nr:class I SAM-dependent methyltransferase [Anaerolineae bacterium]